MSQDSDSKSKLIQINNDKTSASETIASKTTTSHLKLVVSNPDPLQETSLPQAPDLYSAKTSFTVDVRVKGPCLYEMSIHDSAHYLACDLILEVEETNQEYGGRAMICHFPTLSDDALNDFIEEDETLYGTIMVQFQMKILEQILLFCATHNASTLAIFTDDAQADALGIYQDFLSYKDQTLTTRGEKTEMIIPADRETFDAWIDFMEKVTTDSQQTLWRHQRSNLVVRHYLKTQGSRVCTPNGKQ